MVMKTIACVACKRRKVKCDSSKQVPCSNCVRYGKHCIASDDRRSLRPTYQELETLRERVKQLERHVQELNSDVLIQREEVMQEASPVYPKPRSFQSLYRHKVNIYGPPSIFDEDGEDGEREGENLDDEEGGDDAENNMKKRKMDMYKNERLGYLGENVDTISDCSSERSISKRNNLSKIVLVSPVNKLNKDPKVIQFVKTFFQWFYPDLHMFIPRETFLVEFYHPRREQVYCNIALVYAICAIAGGGDGYYEVARKQMEKPSSAVIGIQGNILLGLYELRKGDRRKAWLSVGLGLRIGLESGFHLKLERANKLMVLFRSRIYWGCFIIDHLMSFLLGRPPMLRIEESSIEESEKVPDLEWIKEFNFAGKGILDVSATLRAIVSLIIIVDEWILGRCEDVELINGHLQRWRNELSEEMQWDEGKLKSKAYHPPDVVHIMYYYMVFIGINRLYGEGEFLDNAINEGVLVIQTHIEAHGIMRCTLLMHCLARTILKVRPGHSLCVGILEGRVPNTGADHDAGVNALSSIGVGRGGGGDDDAQNAVYNVTQNGNYNMQTGDTHTNHFLDMELDLSDTADSDMNMILDIERWFTLLPE